MFLRQEGDRRKAAATTAIGRTRGEIKTQALLCHALANEIRALAKGTET